jgi:xylulokinase
VYLGIDIGTSGVKAVLVDENGAIVAQASDSLDVSRPAPGFSEQDPQAWWRATVNAVGCRGSTLAAGDPME